MLWYVMDNDLVGLCGPAQGAARVTLLATAWVLAGNAQGLRCGFTHAVARGWLAGVFAIERQSAFEMLDALLHSRHLPDELLHLLLQGPQQPNQLIFLRVAECCEVGQVWHPGRLSLYIS